MAIIDDLKHAATQTISAGANSLRGQGTALRGDFENLVRPELDGILLKIADITEDLTAGNIGAEQARDDLQTQLDRVQPVILGAADLALLALQTVINTVLDALKTVVNSATTRGVGIAVL